MFSKIFPFSHRKCSKKIADGVSDNYNFFAVQRPFPKLEKNDIRVLVFKDSDSKGRTLLFDSKAVVNSDSKDKASNNKTTHEPTKRLAPTKAVQIQAGKSPKISPKKSARPSSDSKMLGEMIFGSVAMTYKGATVKVHVLRSPPQLLMTKVFALKPKIVVPSFGESSEYLSSDSQVDSVLEHSSRIESDNISISSHSNSPKDNDCLLGASSKPVTVPGSSTAQVVIDYDDDSGLAASYDSSWYTPSSSPCGSYQRRWIRSQTTSMDLSFSKKKEESTEELSPVLRRRPKIGIGILFSLSDNEDVGNALQGFFFSHFPLLESHSHRLRLAVENACFSKKLFIPMLQEAVEFFKDNIINLLSSPRLKEPVWLNMMTYSDRRSSLCETFMGHLVDVLSRYNTRETNFFMSGLLTAVLTHHLSWVPTVMPAGTAPDRAYLDKHSSQTLDLLAQSHPYNPLWAQLGDLYGAVGYPMKLTRTVVTGQDDDLISHVLLVLSYFIRCTEVFEHQQKREETSHYEQCGSQKENCSCTGKPNGDSIRDCDEKEKLSDESGINSAEESCNEELTLNCARCNFDFTTECSNLLHSSNSIDCKEIVGVDKNEKNLCLHCGKGRLKLADNELNRLNGLNHQYHSLTVESDALEKEIKQFLPPRTATFKCYCCEDTNPEQSKTSFHSYVAEEAAPKNIHKESFVNNTNTNLVNEPHSNTPATDAVDKKSSGIVTVKDLDRDSCISMDMDSISVTEETVASYGRSGSADSGFQHSPMPSPFTKYPSNICSFSSVSEELDEDLEEELDAEEITLPGVTDFKCYPELNSVDRGFNWRNSNSFGRSLFAGVCDSYRPDFVLQGTVAKNFTAELSNDLKLAVQHSVLDEPVSEAVCILADTESWNCEVISVKKTRRQSSMSSSTEVVQKQLVEASNLVVSMLMAIQGLWNIGMSAEFCLMHLEDQLKEIYLKSKVISECLMERRKPVAKYDLAHLLGIDDNDISLLLAVAGTHAPQGVSFVKVM